MQFVYQLVVRGKLRDDLGVNKCGGTPAWFPVWGAPPPVGPFNFTLRPGLILPNTSVDSLFASGPTHANVDQLCLAFVRKLVARAGLNLVLLRSTCIEARRSTHITWLGMN